MPRHINDNPLQSSLSENHVRLKGRKDISLYSYEAFAALLDRNKQGPGKGALFVLNDGFQEDRLFSVSWQT